MFRGQLFKLLPRTYKSNDTDDEQLRRFVSVFEAGLDKCATTIDTLGRATDPLECGIEHLENIARSHGFTLNPELSEVQKRRLLDALPFIERNRGTNLAFNAIAKELFGSGATAYTTKVNYVNGMTPDQYRKLKVKLGFDVNSPLMDVAEEQATQQFMQVADQFRIANYSLELLFALICYEEYKASVWEDPTNLLPKGFDVLNITTSDVCIMRNGSDLIEEYGTHWDVGYTSLLNLSIKANEFVAF